MICKIKLKAAIQSGKVCVDNRIEGTRYFKNLILFLENWIYIIYIIWINKIEVIVWVKYHNKVLEHKQ